MSSSTVSGLLPFNLANGLDSNAVSRFLESLSRAGGAGGAGGEGGEGGGPRLEKGNADESKQRGGVERRSGRLGATKARQARQIF